MSPSKQHTNILDLNDDCLLEIFSHFELKDLCAVVDCCQRFKYFTNIIIETKFRKKDFDVHLSISSKPLRKVLTENHLIVEKFGECTTHVQINGSSKGTWRFASMWNNCVALKSFKFCKMVLSNVPITNIEKMLENVESLVLEKCDITPFYLAEMLNATKQLKQFIFKGSMLFTSDLCSSFTELMNIETIQWTNLAIHNARPDTFNAYVKHLQPLKNLKHLMISIRRGPFMCVPDIEFLVPIDSLEKLTLY